MQNHRCRAGNDVRHRLHGGGAHVEHVLCRAACNARTRRRRLTTHLLRAARYHACAHGRYVHVKLHRRGFHVRHHKGRSGARQRDNGARSAAPPAAAPGANRRWQLLWQRRQGGVNRLTPGACHLCCCRRCRCRRRPPLVTGSQRAHVLTVVAVVVSVRAVVVLLVTVTALLIIVTGQSLPPRRR